MKAKFNGMEKKYGLTEELRQMYYIEITNKLI